MPDPAQQERMDANPYRIEGPALISFSGGRTSAYMLWHILDAHGGKLPDDVHVCFANTGKEREETLRFVHECATRWGVRINWLERDGPDRFQTVGFNSASRSGEPFAALIGEKGYLPNVASPWCSIALKQRVARQFAMRVFGKRRYFSAVGLRFDEPGRRDSALARALRKRDAWTPICPLYTARVTKRDVLAWWREQVFDLGLKGFEGNCDGCFQKGPRLYEVERYTPGALAWWIDQELAVAETAEPDARHWILGRSYTEISAAIRRQPDLFADLFDDDPDMDAECGLWCEGEAA